MKSCARYALMALALPALALTACGQGQTTSTAATTTTSTAPTTTTTAPPTTTTTAPGHTLTDEFIAISGSGGLFPDCSSSGDLSDIGAAAQVVVKNGRGDILGVTRLGPAVEHNTVHCTYAWSVAFPDEDFYVVAVGQRTGVTFSRSDLSAKNWHTVIRADEGNAGLTVR